MEIIHKYASLNWFLLIDGLIIDISIEQALHLLTLYKYDLPIENKQEKTITYILKNKKDR